MINDERLRLDKALKYQEEGKYREAIEIYNEIIDLNPENIIVLNNIGVCYLALGNPDKAIEFFKRVIKISPKDSDVYFNIGKAFFISDRLKDALKAYKIAEKYRPKDMDIVKNLGIIHLKLGEIGAARINFEFLLRESPKNWEAYFWLAKCYEGMKDFKKAILYLKKAKEYNITNAHIPFEIAKLEEKTGDIKSAEHHLLIAIGLNPADNQIFEYVVRFYMKIGNRVKAIKMLESFLAEHPYNFMANHLMAEIKGETNINKDDVSINALEKEDISKGNWKGFWKKIESSRNWEEGIKKLEKLYKEHKNTEIAKCLGKCYFNAGKEPYIERLKEIISEFSNDKDFLLLKARLMLKEGRNTEARKILLGLLADDINNPEINIYLAHIYFEQSKFKEALSYANNAINKDNISRDALKLIGKIYFKLGKFNEAHQYFTKILRIYPDEYEVYYYLGIISYNNNDFRQSCRLFEHYLQFFNSDYGVKELLGRIYLRLKKIDKAKNIWQDLSEISANNIDDLLIKARAYFYLEEFELSYKTLKLAQSIGPDNGSIYYYFAFYHVIKNDIKKAVRDFISAWQFDDVFFKKESSFLSNYFKKEILDIIITALEDSNSSIAHNIAFFWRSII